jgi:hypothetical protein
VAQLRGCGGSVEGMWGLSYGDVGTRLRGCGGSVIGDVVAQLWGVCGGSAMGGMWGLS